MGEKFQFEFTEEEKISRGTESSTPKREKVCRTCDTGLGSTTNDER